MSEINYAAVVAAAIAAFIASGIWYSIFGTAMAKLQGKKPGESDKMEPWQIGVELLRSAVVALTLAYLLGEAGVTTVTKAAAYGALLWIAFPLVLLIGSIMHEKFQPKLAAIHAGDWLFKLLLIAVIVSVWR